MLLDYKLDFKTQKFAVVGIGDTGVSIVNYLHYQKANLVKMFDTRENPPPGQLDAFKSKFSEIPVHLGKLDYALLSDVDVIVISPGVSIYDEVLQLALCNNKIVVGDIELFAQAIKNWDSQVLGITGSNGKTTVTSLTGFLLECLGMNVLVAGNIGTPVLNSYLEIVKSGQIPQVIVLELSSFQLETTYSMQFAAATTLNISEDHLDRYRDLLEYAYAKANIFNNCKVQVLNHDDVLVSAMARHGREISWFGTENTNKFTLSADNEPYLQVDGKKFMRCQELGLIGLHNYFNVLASLALLAAIGINIEQDSIKTALREFKGLEHRMQKVVEHNGVLYIEDSKGTNVGAVVAGISGLDMPVHLILGGDGKGQDFTPLRELVASKCRSVAIIGQDKALITKALSGLKLPIEEFATLPLAVKFCMDNAKSGECVALSPACASWDMFDNYKQRAEIFIDSIYENIN